MKLSTRPRRFLRRFNTNSIFESMRSYNGHIFKLDEHIKRLKSSANTLGVNISEKEISVLRKYIAQEYKNSKIKDAYIRIALSVPDKEKSIIIKKAKIWPKSVYAKGVSIKTSAAGKNHANAVSRNAKSSDFSAAICARIDSENVFELLMLEARGYVSEATVSNIFIIKNRQILAPPVSNGILNGITRQAIFDIAAKARIEIYEQNLTRHDLFNADECFLTNTTMQVMPVVEIDGRIIGSGKPGKITKMLIGMLKQFIWQSTLSPKGKLVPVAEGEGEG